MDKFIVVLTQNRNLGMIASAYFAVDIDTSPSLSLREKVNTEDPKKHNYDYSDYELEILEVLNKTTDRYLFNTFSKDLSIKQFYEKLDDNRLEELIRPHIENQMMACFDILAKSNTINIYFKDSKYSNIYKSDMIFVYPEIAEPIFYFDLDESGIKYSLKIKTKNGDISLTHKNPMVITHSPCSILIREQLYRFKNTDSKKFIPFFEKTAVQIQPRSVPNYMNTFVKNAVTNLQVKNTGFSVIDDTIEPKAKLKLGYNLQQEPILTLDLMYGNKAHQANSTSKIVVELNNSDDIYTFHRYQRDKVWEADIINQLIKLGISHVGGPVYYPTGYSQPYEFYPIIDWYNSNRVALNGLGIVLNQDVLEKEYYFGEASCQLSTSKKNDWYDLQMIVKVGEFEISYLKFRKYIIAGKKEYELPDGKLFVIPKEWFSKYTDILLYAEESNNTLRLKRIFKHLIEKGPSEKPEVQAHKNSRSVPDTLNATLRPYQQQGYSWMSYLNNNNYGGILADDMGLGKTLQTIALLLSIYQVEGNQDAPIKDNTPKGELFDSGIEGFNTSGYEASLIVMPTTLIHNWLNEFEKFAPSLKVYIYSGTKRLKSKEIGKIFRHYHVVLSTYGVARNDVEFLKPYPFHYFILDESQYIKNPTSKIYQAITQINSNRKLVLTGTPIENSLVDLWAQMNFVNEGLLGTLNFFKIHFAQPISKLNNQEQKEKLQELIEPFILRRTKDKVAKELPPVSEQVLLCDMTADQKKVYESEKSGIRNELLKTFAKEGMERSSFLALQGLTQLRQIANHPKLIDPEYSGKSGKYTLILDKLNNIIQEKHKVLIFSSFVKDLDLIETELIKNKTSYSKLTGSTTNRQAVVDKFEKDEKCSVFLISLKAGGVGLNLVSADYVFLLNPWWNPAAESQAINRAHRIGQTKNVFVYRFISTDTIEEKIMRLQEHKSELANTFINSNNPFKNLSEQEITELFT